MQKLILYILLILFIAFIFGVILNKPIGSPNSLEPVSIIFLQHKYGPIIKKEPITYMITTKYGYNIEVIKVSKGYFIKSISKPKRTPPNEVRGQIIK